MRTIVTVDLPARKTFRLLGIALAISVVIAFPVEQVTHNFHSPGSYWLAHACDTARIGLNLGNIVQAILAPLLVFLLPRPGSIFNKKGAPQLLFRASQATVFIAAGCVCAGMIPVAWWFGLREYTRTRGVCPALFDGSLPVHSFQPDPLADLYHYFVYLSLFAALWVGITAGGLRLESDRSLVDTPGNQSRRFYWACMMGWLVLGRISTWPQTTRTAQEWPFLALVCFIFLTASSLWTLAFVRFLWNNKPRTWLHAVIPPFWVSLLIYLLTALTFFWAPVYAGLTLLFPLLSFNLYGLVWAIFVGTWRWRALQGRPHELRTAGE